MKNKDTKSLKTSKGRPKAELDEDLILKMAEEQCTADQIAAVCNVHRDTIYARYSDVLHRGKDIGRRRLIAAMWRKALVDGDTKMMIWLSKQHLGYKENTQDHGNHTTYNVTIKEMP
jgi:hypothetical protein